MMHLREKARLRTVHVQPATILQEYSKPPFRMSIRGGGGGHKELTFPERGLQCNYITRANVAVGMGDRVAR